MRYYELDSQCSSEKKGRAVCCACPVWENLASCGTFTLKEKVYPCRLASSPIFIKLLHSVQHRVRRHDGLPWNHAATTSIALRLATNKVRLIFSPVCSVNIRQTGKEDMERRQP